MKTEDIFALWEEDSRINKAEIGREALNLPNLHHKYYTIYMNEKLVLKKREAEFTVMKKEKIEFYTDGHTEETRAKGWELPPKGRIARGDVNLYVDADKDIIEASLKIGVQQEKVELLKHIIYTLNNRNFLFKTYIDFEKFRNGG
jgi:hypothetical protein